MHSTIKLGVVGFGRVIELVHLPMLKKMPEVEVCGIYDITPQRRDLAAKRGFRVYDQVNALLDSELDAVIIATPPNSHYELAVQSLRKGKHVLLEKPVTQTAEEAENLLKVARETGKLVTVFQNRRFDADFLYVKKTIQSGILGPILFVHRRQHMFGSGASFGVKSFHPGWRDDAQYGGGALLDWGVHLIDQLLQLQLGTYIDIDARMYAMRWGQGDVDDYVDAVLRLDNGTFMSLEVNFGSNAAAPLWVVGGELATLQVISGKEAILMEKGKREQRLEIESAPGEGQEHIYHSFIGCLLRGEEPEVRLEQAVETMRVIDAIRDSANRKRR